jgi:hypothetical protein
MLSEKYYVLLAVLSLKEWRETFRTVYEHASRIGPDLAFIFLTCSEI